MQAAVFPGDSRCFPPCPAGESTFPLHASGVALVFLQLLSFSLAFSGWSTLISPAALGLHYGERELGVCVGLNSYSKTMLEKRSFCPG